MIINECSGFNKTRFPPVFSISVDGVPAVDGTHYRYAQETREDGTVDWELALLADCVITFARVVKCDVFLVGGGSSGNAASGSGGSGGRRLTKLSQTIPTHTAESVAIGASGQATSAFGLSTTDSDAVGGAPGVGGGWVGDGGDVHHAAAGAQNNGEYAFGESASLISALSGRKYSPGGGGGACQTGNYIVANSSNGGATGGGAGGSLSSKNGGNGASNTGAGGGGPCRDGVYGNGTAGAGGSGIAILRNARGGGAA